MKGNIEVSDYGDMLSKILEKELVFYQEIGEYQGEYIAILEQDDNWYIYSDNYGSCSGCDWLESEYVYDDNCEHRTVPYKSALEYCNQMVVKYIIPKKIFKKLSIEEISELIDKDYKDSWDIDEDDYTDSAKKILDLLR